MSMRSAASCGQPADSVSSSHGGPGSDGRFARAHGRPPDRRRRRPTRAPRRTTSCSAAASSGASQRSGPGPGTTRAHGGDGRAGAGGGRQRRAEVERRAPHTSSSTARIRPGWRRRRAACARPPHPIDTWSSCIALGGQRVDAGGPARRRFSATIAAAVYWAIISPEFTPASVGEERRQPVRAGAVEHAVGAALGDRADIGHRDGEEVGGVARAGAPWKLPHDSTRPSGRTIGLSMADTSSTLGDAARRSATVSRAAPCTCGVQRSEYASCTRSSPLAVAGDDRRTGEQARRLAALRRLAGLRAQTLQVVGEGAVGAEQRLDGHGRDDVGDDQEVVEVVEGQQQHAEHAVGAVDEREPFLRAQRERASVRRRPSASAARHHLAVGRRRLALADQHERAGGRAARGRRWRRASRARARRA